MHNIIYFELNNWIPGKHYPKAEPFSTWMDNDSNLAFMDENFVKENKLCVFISVIDMSINFCITATKKWVQRTCPELLTTYNEFMREREEDGIVYGQFGDEFIEYNEQNIGIHYYNTK